MKPAPKPAPNLCKFCRKAHQRAATECAVFRRFRIDRIGRCHRRQLALEAANTDTTNTEFSDLPEV